jgi:L-malate glycosyltransferase
LKKLKIGIVSTMRGYPWAGSEEAWKDLASIALAAGHAVAAFVHADSAGSAQLMDFREHGGEVNTWKESLIPRVRHLREIFNPSFPASRLNKFDVLLVSLGSFPSVCYTPGLLAGLLRTGSPVVLLCQFNSDHLTISPNERAELRGLIERARACAFVSAQNVEVARRQFGLPLPEAVVILNQSRERRAKPLPWPNGTGPLCLANVARLEILWKGQDVLLDVLSRSPWKERHWHLTIYGTGPDEGHLRSLAGHLDLRGRVDFAGYVRDLTAIWERNHLLALPSRGEGTPSVALEAMMFGRPVVTTDVGGNMEVLEEGVTGFIAEAPTTRSFGAALERAWLTRNCWPAMGEAGHRRALEISAGNPAGKLLALLENCACK